MQALQEELLNEEWTFVFPNFNEMYEIHTFDDGNERLNIYENTWVKFGDWKDKVALFNYYAPDIKIKSISDWKMKQKKL